jgi:hypothetical protein
MDSFIVVLLYIDVKEEIKDEDIKPSMRVGSDIHLVDTVKDTKP